ncbi:mitochondrial carrier domain-containing protein [Tribonema minus]|uniref:Mitochondrial carrier domain-containing protein n=1 Tax=Tribonema minus TaxID=303371 RepID=A0A836C9B4_9STRA|nr:mitochondrial carrier domain-containing protein [Tribonema minus]
MVAELAAGAASRKRHAARSIVGTLIPAAWHDTFAGCVSGAVSRLATAPLDVAKIRCQLDGGRGSARYDGLLMTFRSVYAEEGLVSLWRGSPAAMMLWVSYSGVQFGVYPVFRRLLMRWRRWAHQEEASLFLQQRDRFLAGAAAGCVATTATYPFDVMRTAFAGQGVPRQHETLHAFVAGTLRTKGARGLYAGLTPAIMQMAPQIGIAFVCYEAMRDNVPAALRALPAVGAWWPAAAGFTAGLVSKIAVYPVDTLKKRMQAQAVLAGRGVAESGGAGGAGSGGVRAAALSVWREGARVALYRGMVPALWKSSVSTAVTFGTYEWVKRRIDVVDDGGDE